MDTSGSDTINNQRERTLFRDFVNTLPQAAWHGDILLVKDRDFARFLIPMLEKGDESAVLGFDTETRPAFHKGQKFPVSLLQLAGKERVLLFQINQIGLSSALCKLLENSAIIKVGVGLEYDLNMLRELRDFQPSGFVDLADMARKRGLAHRGLRGLAAALLGLRISKGARTSNWDAKELSAKQIRYAATDAWISREIYFALENLPIVTKDSSKIEG